MIISGKRKMNIGTIGTTANLSKKYGAGTARRNLRNRKWNISSTNHEASKQLIKKYKNAENERTIEEQHTKTTQTNKNQEPVNGM